MIEHPLFGISLTILVFSLFRKLQVKTKISLLNPLLFSSILIILILIVFNISYDDYNGGAKIFTSLIGPATVALAIPLYKHQDLFYKNIKLILISVLSSAIAHGLVITLLVYLFKLDLKLGASLIPKSVTTAIAGDVSTALGGYTNVTVAIVIITGIIGASLAPLLNKVFNINSPIAQGLALGSSAHAVGTSKAIELGETQETMATLALILTGILTVFLSPFIYSALMYII
ncbi:LrgB family protein [Erysipelothrix urinaevulpis]|uniref:LrgB family protein n=1 Tax=Erysipelothrix urinaevulpis TaxID=2683717 RepID=UPI00135BD22B|nr:LrgB family protein [Erysipelothrix urinaevulpis]